MMSIEFFANKESRKKVVNTCFFFFYDICIPQA